MWRRDCNLVKVFGMYSCVSEKAWQVWEEEEGLDGGTKETVVFGYERKEKINVAVKMLINWVY